MSSSDKPGRKPYPRAYLEITNVCNLSCNFCPKTSRKPSYISRESFSALIRQIKPLANMVYFHIMGEPLLHPLLLDFLEECYELGLPVSLTTNGTLIGSCQPVLLASPALYRVSISLHSFEANSLSISLDEYLENILTYVVASSQRTKTISVLRLWNKDSLSLKASNQLNADILNRLTSEFHLDYDLAEALEQNHSVKLCERVYVETAEKFSWPDISRDNPLDEVFCYGLRSQFGVLSDGTLVPCCLDSEGRINLGNALEKPLAEMLESNRARKIYGGFSRRIAVEELCRRCGYAQRFSTI